MRWVVLVPLLLAPRIGVAAERSACPAAIATSVERGAIPGWVVVPQPASRSFFHHGPETPGHRRFARLSLMDGLPADFDREAMAVLMPDEGASGPLRPPLLRQRWDPGLGATQGSRWHAPMPAPPRGSTAQCPPGCGTACRPSR